MNTPVKTPKRRRAPVLIQYGIDEDLEVAMKTFYDNASPKLRQKLEETGLEGWKQRVTVYALRQLVESPTGTRAFGAGIEKTVDEIITRNMAAHDAGEWWNITGLGRSTLVNAGHNPLSVKRWLEINSQRIAEHHAAVGIDNVMDHNRKAAKARRQGAS